MQTGSLNWFFKILKKEICIKKIYYFILDKLTDLKSNIKEEKLNNFSLSINKKDITYQDLIIKQLESTQVILKKTEINCISGSVCFHKIQNSFEICSANIKQIALMFSQISWKAQNINYCCILRNYPLHVNSTIHTITNNELIFNKTPKFNVIKADTIKINQQLRITQEIINIKPYLNIFSRIKLYKIPIIKEPLYKTYFSEDEILVFKEALASQNGTKPRNVDILGIYDKFNPEFYSLIKQDVNSKKLICFPSEKAIKSDKNKLYYLLVGNRKDNKVPIKALLPVSKLFI